MANQSVSFLDQPPTLGSVGANGKKELPVILAVKEHDRRKEVHM